MEDLISVIIPAYNSETTIEECIKSISGENVEIIVVIDGATDNTLKVCKDLQKSVKDMKIVEQQNQGPFKSRETGIKNAKGKYIMFLDADDCYFENTITRVRELIKKYNEPDLIRFRYRKMPNGYDQYKYIELDEEEIKKKDFSKRVYPMFINGYMLNALWTNCVKREIIENIKTPIDNIRYGEDLVKNLEIFSNIESVVFTNDVLYQYNYMENSMTNKKTLSNILGNLSDAIELYSLLHIYLLKWNMYSIENIQAVNKRIQKEANILIDRINEAE